jgi:hypothetical protein
MLRERLSIEETGVAVFASGIALFMSGAAFGATISHWYDGADTAWGPLCASLVIAVLAGEGLRRALSRPRS